MACACVLEAVEVLRRYIPRRQEHAEAKEQQYWCLLCNFLFLLFDLLTSPLQTPRRTMCGVRKITPAACLRRESPGAASGGRFRYTPELRS